MNKLIATTIAASAALTMGMQTAIAAPDAGAIFKSKCSMCHKIDKKKVGPAFKDMNKDIAALKATITNGRKMMPKWKGKLSEEEINAMVEFIKSKQDS